MTDLELVAAMASGKQEALRAFNQRYGNAIAVVAERKAQVSRILAELKDGEREVLELAYFSDLSQAEIAERTGLPLGTVKTRMRTALIKLRDSLAGRAD